jgi:glycosyltransferase involved in cell wall biosynthesis
VTATVTVVVPTRDRWHLLSTSALPAALGQEGVDVEVVVVDDASRDETAAHLEAVGDSRLRVIRHHTPRGVGAARNAGIAAAESDWIAFLDDDDLWSPRKLSVQLAAIERSRAAFAYCDAISVDPDRTPRSRVAAPGGEGLLDLLLTRNVIPAGSSNVLVATALAHSVGGFDERLSYLADWDLWLRLAQRGRAVSCPEPLVAYVRHRGRMSLGADEAVRELRVLEEKHRDAGFRPDYGSFLAWIAREHRQARRRTQAIQSYVRAAVETRDPRHLVRVPSTVLDHRGDGLRNVLGRRPVAEESIVAPEWLGRV